MKKLLALLVVMLVILAASLVWVVSSFHFVDGQIYPRKAEFLNLQGKEISVQHVEALKAKMPETDILWNVPFQGRLYPSDTKNLTVTDMSRDMDMLVHFPGLETLDARGCGDLSSVGMLREQYPNLTILAEVSFGGQLYPYDVKELELNTISEEDLAVLPRLTALEQVTVVEGGAAENFPALKEYCENHGIAFRIIFCGNVITEDTTELAISSVSDNQIPFLSLMHWLKSLHFPEPEAAPERLLELREQLPDTVITWEKTILGMTFDQDVTEVNLTPVLALGEGEAPGTKTAYEYGLEYTPMGYREEEPTTAKVLDGHPFPDRTEMTQQILAEVENAMAYFPKAEKLIMCGTWLDNEAMSQLRERHRRDYKVIWTVLCGDIAPRTDTTFFMPTKYGAVSGGFNELYSENLKYCEEIVSMDIGHMQIVDIDFVRYMPNLQYLVIFSQPVMDLSPLASCKNLVFLEMSMCTWVTDYSPLLECTVLEDLNIATNTADISPLLEMTWLKNLWMGNCSTAAYNAAKQALPDTNIAADWSASFKWRALPNYFKMRDALLMFYMQ